MADRKLFAGYGVRRVRRAQGQTQAAMAEGLGISASYLNLIERNQRPVTATLLMRLADLYDFDPRTLSGDAPGGGAEAMRRRLADPMFADLAIDRAEVDEWLAAAPGGATAFALAFDRLIAGGAGPAIGPADPEVAVERAVARWRNHFADLDAQAEAIADELRLGAGDLFGGLSERLRVKHQLSLRILPWEVMPDRLARLDLHARQLQLSELLSPGDRILEIGVQIALLEARAEIDAIVSGAGLDDRAGERLMRRRAADYFAAALAMPYGRFLRACEATGYDPDLLAARFGVGFTAIAGRLTSLQRVGARGLPFFLVAVDPAGQMVRRIAGASGSALADADGRCPLWNLHTAFTDPGRAQVQLIEEESGARWLTLARAIDRPGRGPGGVTGRIAVGIGVEASHAGVMAAARGIDLTGPGATPIGLGCRACTRPDCPQRAHPPAGRPLRMTDRERGVNPYPFSGD
ncbi:short-chain fatty acyl-CoA regulator family protein [Sphingomonas naphthae]|uniref:Short-chain fatty acyl-CoA regulator family protein n=1 Tax=Sphingomonas naphthae TaxID=1813468 RepID=A0ABY7TMV8_9SPHN|nr:helix-turn-helix transcriptional regulator [Sphingomonas naphthae]WCT74555.1 short-chain fatty acyl-CoA regulator family protein [Sphingomonas naphthae]